MLQIEPPPSARPSQLCLPGSWTLVALVQARLVAPETKKPGFLRDGKEADCVGSPSPKEAGGRNTHSHNAGMSHEVVSIRHNLRSQAGGAGHSGGSGRVKSP